MKKKRLFSGMQPSGALHLGNYMGALKQWVDLSEQDAYECIYCIVDYHAITAPYDPEILQQRIHDATVDYLAGGLDPEKCTIFVQSHVPEHTELAWIFNAVTPLGQLMRMTQFKQKTLQFTEPGEESEESEATEESQSEDGLDRKDFLSRAGGIGAGILTYPVLQAADILLYKGQVVPVGEDQVQHIELTRDIARRFNNRFAEVFPACEALLSEAPRVMGLDAVNKMSKSIGNHIPLNLRSKEVVQKVTRESISDSRRVTLADPGVPEECNIYDWHTLFSSEEEQAWAHHGCRTAEIGCFKCKKTVAKNINAILAPMRERREAIAQQPDFVEDVLAQGAKRARAIAQETMEQVREALGIGTHAR